MKYSFTIKDREFDSIMSSYDKAIEGITPAIEKFVDSLNKAIEAYKASQNDSNNAIELARENGYLRALAGLPLNGSAKNDKKPDIKFGDEA